MGLCSNSFDVYLNEKDYEEAYKDNGGWSPPSQDEFTVCQVHGPNVTFSKVNPDYEEGFSYYYFEQKQCISDYGSVFGTEVLIMQKDSQNDWRKLAYDGGNTFCGCHVKDAIDAYYEKKGIKTDKVEKEVVKERCWHPKKKVVYLFVSAYWCCCTCGHDMGTLTDSEFYENVKKFNPKG